MNVCRLGFGLFFVYGFFFHLYSAGYPVQGMAPRTAKMDLPTQISVIKVILQTRMLAVIQVILDSVKFELMLTTILITE